MKTALALFFGCLTFAAQAASPLRLKLLPQGVWSTELNPSGAQRRNPDERVPGRIDVLRAKAVGPGHWVSEKACRVDIKIPAYEIKGHEDAAFAGGNFSCVDDSGTQIYVTAIIVTDPSRGKVFGTNLRVGDSSQSAFFRTTQTSLRSMELQLEQPTPEKGNPTQDYYLVSVSTLDP